MPQRRPARPSAQVALVFAPERFLSAHSDPVHKNLSAVAHVGEDLFVAADEAASLKRLRRTAEGRFEEDREFRLAELVDLPDQDPEAEMDIEGLSRSGDRLWVIGSHALKRKKPNADKHGPEKALRRMRKVVREANRYVLACIPLEAEADGSYAPRRECAGGVAAMLDAGEPSALEAALAEDPHLGPFLDIPSKENGLDIEGIAVEGDRVWLGLRGPVLRGYAVVLSIRVEEAEPGRLVLKPDADGALYSKHLIDTRGLGIRDLRLRGDDLLLLVGPTMSLEGPARILRWRGARAVESSGLVDPSEVAILADLTYEHDYDHPEGLELWPDEAGRHALVLYDAPDPKRVDRAAGTVLADVIPLKRR